MQLKYYKELDGVRAIAAIMIMFFHFFQGYHVNDVSLNLIRKFAVFGQTGVSLFFVLSGFLITRILLATKENDNYFSSFYGRRALRIFPLYYLFLCIYYFIYPVLFNTPSDAGNGYLYLLYLQNFANTFNWSINGPFHFWSLAVEEHFYLFWPLLIYFLNYKGIVTAIISIIVIAFLCRIVLVMHHYEVFYFTFSRMDELAVGAILALLEIKGKLTPKKFPFFLTLLGVTIVPVLLLWTVFSGNGNPIIQVCKFIFLSFTYFAVIGCIVTSGQTNIIKRILQSKPFLYSGKISYGLYVYHPFAFALVHLFIGSNSLFIDLVISFALSYLLSAISYHYFESYFLRLKKIFGYNGGKMKLSFNELIKRR